MGEGEGSEGAPDVAHNEPGCAEEDRRSTASPMGKGEGAKEGRLSSVVLREQKARARTFYPGT